MSSQLHQGLTIKYPLSVNQPPPTEAGNRALPAPQWQPPFLLSQSVEKHKSKISKSRNGDFSQHGTAAAGTAQETSFGELAPAQLMPAKEQKAKEEET